MATARAQQTTVEALKAISAFAVFALIAFVLMAIVWYAVISGSPKTPTTRIAHIKGEAILGCEKREDFERLTRYVNAGDKVAAAKVAWESCIILPDKSEVYVEDASSNGLTAVQRAGQTITYWTSSGNVDRH